MARTLSPAELGKLYSADTKTHARLVVEGLPLAELVSTGTDPLLKASVVGDLDEVAEKGTFTLRVLRGSDSLSPYLSTGLQISGFPALSEDRAVAWEIQQTAPGASPGGAWRRVFQGIIDTVQVDPVKGTVTVNCRGLASKLLSTEIENITANRDGVMQWGFPVPSNDAIAARTDLLVQDAVQYILDTAWQYAYGSPFPDPFVIVGTPPTTTAVAQWLDRTNIMQAIRDWGTGKSGWDIRYRWDLPSQGQDSFALAMYLPDRFGAGTALPLLRSRTGSNLVYNKITGLTLDIVGIRNVAEVTPADEARVPVVTTNPASIARVGRRAEAVSEDLANHIDTPAEAGDLGTIIVTDGGNAKSAIELALPFTWCFELNDLFSVGADGVCFDRTDLVFGVTHYELAYEKGKGSTVLQGREAGAATGSKQWRDLSVHRTPTTVYVRTFPPVGPGRPNAIWVQVAPAP